MGTILTVSDRGQITIPVFLRRLTNLSAGKKLIAYQSEGNSLLLQPIDEEDVMDLYASVDPKGETTNPEKAINKAKILKAKNP